MYVKVITSSPVPRYEQIKIQIRHAIYGGDISAGELLPSLRQLAAQLRVSVITVTRAYNDLVAEGLVSNEHGRGFVVLPVTPAGAQAALLNRLDSAIEDVVATGRAAHLHIDEVLRKVSSVWMSK